MSSSPDSSNGKSSKSVGVTQPGAFFGFDYEEPSRIFSPNQSATSDVTSESGPIAYKGDAPWSECSTGHNISNIPNSPQVSKDNSSFSNLHPSNAIVVSTLDSVQTNQTMTEFNPDVFEPMDYILNEKDECHILKTINFDSDSTSSQDSKPEELGSSFSALKNDEHQALLYSAMTVAPNTDPTAYQPLSQRQSRRVAAINPGAVHVAPTTFGFQEPDRPEQGTNGIVLIGDQGIAARPDTIDDTTLQGNMESLQDDGLAIAVAVNEDDDNRLLPSAMTLDLKAQDQQRYLSRRFRSYMIVICLFFLILLTIIIGFVLLRRESAFSLENNSPTFAPTSLQDRSYFQQFAQSLGYQVWNFTVESPYGRAAKWIMEEDERKLSPYDEGLIQRFLLAVFYFITTSNGKYPWRSCNPDFTNSSNDICVDEFVFKRNISYRWLSKVHDCKWEGISCDDLDIIHSINLSNQSITGTLPTELAVFPVLQLISLPHNDFTGTLPVEYASTDMARHLISLELQDNQLQGTIPLQYFSLTELAYFSIGQNYFTGTLSSEIGFLTSLKGLHTFSNMISGPIPTEIGKLEYITQTRLHENMHNGTIPTEFGNLLQIQELWLGMNYLTGSIPSELGLLTDMTDLQAFENKLEGTIPSELYSLSNLYYLALDSNFISGRISTGVGNFTAIKGLWLSRNQLTGAIPIELASLSLLQSLWLHSNKLVGSVPTEICDLMSKRFGNHYILQTDCFPVGNEPNPCTCCTACCSRDTEMCLDIDANNPNS